MDDTSDSLEKVENKLESEEAAKDIEMKPELKFIIKDFAKTNISENSAVDIETLVEEEFNEDTIVIDEESDDLDFKEIEEPVSPPPSEPNEVILVEDDQDDETEVAEETKNNAGNIIELK